MVFSSFTFIFGFFPVLTGLYFLLPARCRGLRNLLLLAFSLFFYGYGGPSFLLLMLGSIAINYIGGLLVRPGAQHQSLWKILIIAANLTLLGWFKYANFLGDTLALTGIHLPIPNIVLPIGISFFTFQGMSYVLDVSRGAAQPERNPLRVALYISFFPQLVAGPIVRYTTIAKEISHRKETLSDVSSGVTRFLFGLGKKLILANGVGIVADEVFSIPAGDLTISLAWLGAISYTLQIYFDFSAYSDMAIGLGHMFGFHFLENFKYPYIARSITDFWRRWHISLSSWFRDYVYIPLGGNRQGVKRHILNLLIVWVLTGLWHGAAWTFVCWGLFYFVLLVGERFIWGRWVQHLGWFGHIYTMFFVILAWVFFRSNSISYAGSMIAAMLGHAPLTDNRTTYFLLEYGIIFLPALVCCLPIKVWLEDWLKKRQEHFIAHAILIWGPKVLALGLFSLSYIQLLTSTFNPFIYFRF